MKGLAAVWSLGCAVMTSSYGLHALCRSLLRCLSKPGSSSPPHSASRHSSAQVTKVRVKLGRWIELLQFEMRILYLCESTFVWNIVILWDSYSSSE